MAYPSSGLLVAMVVPEDMPTLLYEEELLKAHIRLECRTSAAEGVEMIDDLCSIGRPPSLICIALELGSHNGLELVHEIRSQRDWDELKIVLITLGNSELLGITNESIEGYGVAEVVDYRQFSPKRLIELTKKAALDTTSLTQEGQ